MKINAIITETTCKHGQTVYNYDYEMDFIEFSSVICKCPTCAKSKIIYSPISGRFFYDNKGKVEYTFRNKVRVGKVTKGVYPNRFEVTLEELMKYEDSN